MSGKIKDRIVKRRRSVDESEEGVATTVGTIMALLVFLSLLSLITQQYVPVWMEDNEAYHMETVKGQFAEMKGGIDSLILNDQLGYPRYSSVRLGAEGIPLFASSSPGVLRLRPRWDPDQDKGMRVNWTEEGEETILRSTGNLSLQARNRYFEGQTIIYEHGAILLEQDEGEVMRARPPISIEEIGGDYRIRLTMVDLVGSERDIGGRGTVGVTTELVSSFRNSYENPGNFSFELTTAYPEAWTRHFENETDAPNVISNGNTITLDFEGHDVYELDVIRARVEVELVL
ncbi:MAG: hypothetical protein V5A88_02115 [Candidatus Thermoplasmatota archaeon]